MNKAEAKKNKLRFRKFYKNLTDLLKTHWFGILCTTIILVAFGLRFYDFPNRWGFGSDQARDVIVAREALRMHKIPLVGPFASAGPFVYGPEWYWYLMVSVPMSFFILPGPWIIHTFLSVAVVYLVILVGKQISGELFGIILGILAAVSPSHITQATSLNQQSMVGMLSVVCLYFFVVYLKHRRLRDIFLLSLTVSFSIATHFQAIGLIVLAVAGLILGEIKPKNIALFLLGLFIPFIPLIVFDLRNNFFESKNLLYYYLHDQYNISFEVLGRRWLTYLGIFWPQTWAKVIGGNVLTTYFTIVIIPFFFFYSLMKKSVNKIIFSVFVCFSMIVFILRYYRGPISDSYVSFLHVFIFVMVGWAIFTSLKINKYIGVILLLLITVPSLILDVKNVQGSTNLNVKVASDWSKVLKKKFPGKKISLYDYKHEGTDVSIPVSLYLDTVNQIGDSGVKLGVKIAVPGDKLAVGRFWKYALVDLNGYSSSELVKRKWASVNPSFIYTSVEEWYGQK